MPLEYIWFHVIVLIVLALVMGLSAVNLYYFNQTRQNPTTQVTKNISITMIVLNAVMIALALALFIWALTRLIMAAVKV